MNKDQVRGLDIGTGANLIYPIIGTKAYGWQFVGSEFNKDSIVVTTQIIEANKLSVTLRAQDNPKHIFKDVILSDEYFNFTMCNPPFFGSMLERSDR